MFIADVDVAIVGAGVTGTGVERALAQNSNVRSIAIIEKYGSVAQVNSHPLMNAQTGHKGDKETNHSIEEALKLQQKAKPLYSYVQMKNAPGLYKRMHSMVLGIGRKETAMLRHRHTMLREHFPNLRVIEAAEIGKWEPKVMEGRDPNEEVCALFSDDAFAINYQKLAECMHADALEARPDIKLHFNTKVLKVQKDDARTIITTNVGVIRAKVVVFAAGAYSLFFAHQLGIARHLGIAAFGGNFCDGGHLLNGKVYRPQDEGIPVAADHGDPDVLDTMKTRFGPTINPVFTMERRKIRTALDYFSLPTWRTVSGIWTLLRLLCDPKFFRYIAINQMYSLPMVGLNLYCKWVVQKIVPTAQPSDLVWRVNAGGSRPQIVNTKTGMLEMGDRSIVARYCICNTTPSPGATASVFNGERDAEKTVELLNEQEPGQYHYDHEKARRNLGLDKEFAVTA